MYIVGHKKGANLFMVAIFNSADHMYFHPVVCSFFFHQQHAHMISDGRASIDDIAVKVKTSLHQVFSQVVDVMNLCFIHALLYIPNK